MHGGLEAGTRYVIESLGVSVQPDVDGWFAVCRKVEMLRSHVRT